MKIVAVLCFAMGAVFMFFTALQVIIRGWGPLDLSVFDVYFVVLPSHLLMIAGSFAAAGLLATSAPHS